METTREEAREHAESVFRELRHWFCPMDVTQPADGVIDALTAALEWAATHKAEATELAIGVCARCNGRRTVTHVRAAGGGRVGFGQASVPCPECRRDDYCTAMFGGPVAPLGVLATATPPLPRAPAVDDAEVEKLALLAFDAFLPRTNFTWEIRDEDERERWRNVARAILSATRPDPATTRVVEAARALVQRDGMGAMYIRACDELRAAIAALDAKGTP